MNPINLLTFERAVLCSMKQPIPIAYFNIYERGDVWVKVKDCDGCSWENRQKCCGNCPLLTKAGCIPHLEGIKKPFNCIIIPAPDVCHGWCQIEFECIEGKYKGKIRKVSEPRDVFHSI